jgi:hypothetical protein
MANCDQAHKFLEPQVEKGIQIGQLPDWTCVTGKVAYRVLKGPYTQLAAAWGSFPQQALGTARSAPRGPPGDVYVCSPMDHPNDPGRMLTILYIPV